MLKIIEEKYGLVDKSRWSEGEWTKEPDIVRLIELDTEFWLPAFIRRHDSFGTFNGYVGVLECSPLYGKKYDDIDVDVHGGLTFGGWYRKLLGFDNLFSKEIWWFGFDCSHYMDLNPGMMNLFSRRYGFVEDSRDTYKNIQYVINELESLVQQLKTLEYGIRNKYRSQNHKGKRAGKPK